MPSSNGSAALTKQIRRLIEERRKHTDAIESIDKTLAQIRSLLSGGEATGGGRAAGDQPATAGKRRGRKRRRGHFAVSGEQFVLDLVKSRKNPTTKEINQMWKAEGRGGSADNTLTRLVKEKRLKRQSLEGERGSRYALT